tara:strand:+ start:2233 stop:2481 length:249 start_codon:yes stop_codon:yes gene_type:complete
MEFLTMKDLTSAQRETLTSRYVELVVDSMDHKDMYHFVYNTLVEDYDVLSEIELKDEIRYTFDEETLVDLVDNLDNEVVEVK